MNKLIETSICISPERKRRLIAAARSMNVKVTDVLAALMRKSRAEFRQNNATLWKAVKYQDNESCSFVIWHVSLFPVCYEFGVSQRLVFKVSVSLIYRVAIDLFLDMLVENGLDSKVDECEIPTNYLNSKYNVLYNSKDNAEFWLICWDKRLKTEQRE